MLEPIDADIEVDDYLCRLSIELRGIAEHITWELCLEVPDHESINITELYALLAGSKEAVVKLTNLLAELEKDEDAT